MTIGEAAAQARKKQNFSRKQLAEKAGYDYMTLYYFEEGLRFPRITTVVDFAKALGISVDEYIGNNIPKQNNLMKEGELHG